MTIEPRRVLVTGGAGFIGSHVVDAYRMRGDRVWVVDDLSSGKEANLRDDVEFVHMGIGDARVRDLFRTVQFDVVNHHAAQIDVRVSVEDPLKDAGINIMGLLNILEGARETGVQRVVYVSSGGVVYGEPEEMPTPESAPKLPLSPYGVGKLTGEYYLNYYRRIHEMPYVALRYSNVFGPRQDPHGEAGVVAIFCQRLLAEQPIVIFGDGEQTRDYVFVEDVALANMKATDLSLPDDGDLNAWAFNVGTGIGTSVNRLADTLEHIAGVHPGREYRAARPGELRHSMLNASKFGDRGWAPQFGIEAALKKTFQHIASGQAAGAGAS